MKHLMPPLPYAPSALDPLLSEETIRYHYGKHLQTYVDNLNKLAEGTPYADMCLELIITTAPEGALRNNAAQVWNHTFSCDGLTPAPKTIPAGLQKQLCADFGSVEAFRTALQTAAAGLFGSGWTWLVLDADCHLRVLPLSNAGAWPRSPSARPWTCIISRRRPRPQGCGPPLRHRCGKSENSCTFARKSPCGKC